MKSIPLYILLCITAATSFAADKKTLTGKITDKETGAPLPGVTIYSTDLKTGTVSDIDGNYKIENLPASIIHLQISNIGYKLRIETIDLAIVTNIDFALEESVSELHEIVVTGLSQSAEKNRTPTPISTITAKEMQQLATNNIIDAIATQPGISQITTGSGISKPVIRGLGYNRVVVVNDGIRQEGQQWGDEHGIEIDEFSIYKVEILKGPASLAYGSDAMAGIINMLSAPTLPNGSITANLLANYQTNNGLMGLSANCSGNQNGLIWDARYSNKRSHAYQNKYDGYVLNSGFNENNLSGVVGFNKSWGYSHLHFSVYHLTPSIVEGERDSATGKFITRVLINDSTFENSIANEQQLKSYSPSTPYQKVNHYKLVLNNAFVIKNGSLKSTIGWQQNQRKEFADVLNENTYGLYFLLNTINYDLKYVLPEKNDFNISFGINGMYQVSQNKGIEFLVPEYNLFDAGLYTIVKKSFDKLDISGGLRYDSRTERTKNLFLNSDGIKTVMEDPDATQKFVAFNTTFSGVSGSIGAAYQFSEIVFTKFNVSRGYRAPNIAELGSNGEHEGTLRYEIGDIKLKAENSLQFDFALGLNSEHVTAELDLFNNSINNYIYSRHLTSAFGGDSITDGLTTFQFVATKANLMGGEISIDLHPHPFDWLHFENSFSYVLATQQNQPDSSKYLPLIPAPKFSSELKANARKLTNNLKNAYIQTTLEYYFKQDKYFAAYGTETETPAYLLLNLGAGTDFVNKNRTLFSLYISINNLADVAYQSHLSRLKYAPENYGTGRTGIYNMGRNVSFKILIPIELRKQKS